MRLMDAAAWVREARRRGKIVLTSLFILGMTFIRLGGGGWGWVDVFDPLRLFGVHDVRSGIQSISKLEVALKMRDIAGVMTARSVPAWPHTHAHTHKHSHTHTELHP